MLIIRCNFFPTGRWAYNGGWGVGSRILRYCRKDFCLQDLGGLIFGWAGGGGSFSEFCGTSKYLYKDTACGMWVNAEVYESKIS